MASMEDKLNKIQEFIPLISYLNAIECKNSLDKTNEISDKIELIIGYLYEESMILSKKDYDSNLLYIRSKSEALIQKLEILYDKQDIDMSSHVMLDQEMKVLSHVEYKAYALSLALSYIVDNIPVETFKHKNYEMEKNLIVAKVNELQKTQKILKDLNSEMAELLTKIADLLHFTEEQFIAFPYLNIEFDEIAKMSSEEVLRLRQRISEDKRKAMLKQLDQYSPAITRALRRVELIRRKVYKRISQI